MGLPGAPDIDPLAVIIFLVVLNLVVATSCYFVVPYWWTRNLMNATRRLLAEGSNRTLTGWRELEIVDHRLIMVTELIRSSVDLRAIDRIVGNDQYTFVYISSTAAYIIPMQLYPEHEYREFVAELREAWENRE